MTVSIEKEDLISALDNYRVTFHAEGDLTPTDVDELLRKNADRLADSSGKRDINIDSLFENDSATKVATHTERKQKPRFCRTRG